MRLYAVTDRSWLEGQTLYSQVEKALKGGVTCVQLREKKRPTSDFLEEGLSIARLCKKYNVPLIINDDVSVALRCQADGIHIGQQDTPLLDVRRLVGNTVIIGVSVHNVQEALDAVANGADYLGVGAAFSTSTKQDASVLSHKTISDICNAVNIPVVAIGGINKKNIQHLAGTGIHGVALVSAIFSSKDIEKTCQELYQLSDSMVNASSS